MTQRSFPVFTTSTQLATNSDANSSLDGIDTTQYDSGTFAWVKEGANPDRLYRLDITSVAPPDGVTIVQPITGPGRWIAFPQGGSGGGDFSGPAGSTAGNFVSFADGTGKLGADSGVAASAVVLSSRTLTAGAGLTGGGNLTADRTFAVGVNADGSITVNAANIQVGVLATNAQHGVRGGGTQHALAVAGGLAGFISGAAQQALEDLADNPPVANIQGLHTANNGANPDEVIDIDPGKIESSDGTFLIVLPGAISIDITTGLDTGAAPVLDTWYALWIIADSTGANATTARFSASFAAPIFPVGYDKATRIHAVRTDATVDILPFVMPKMSGPSRWTIWEDESIIQTTGTAITYTLTAIPASNFVPPSAVNQQLGVSATKLGGTSITAHVEVIADGANEAAGNNPYVVGVGLNSSEDITINGIFEMPVDPINQLVKYLIAPTADAQTTMVVKGWEDAL